MAHTSGITIASENELDDTFWAEYESEGEVESISYANNHWWSIESLEDTLLLSKFSHDLDDHSIQQLLISLPSTVLSVDLHVEDYLYVAVEGLLSIDRYVSNNLSVYAQFSPWQEGEYWPEDAPSSSSLEPSFCNGKSAVSSSAIGSLSLIHI